jgi:glyoxylase-like metal-dependent hydrolase (beta-lactamase superfamily II)
VLPKDKDMTIPPEIEPYSCMADMVFEKEKTIDWKGHKIELVSTPGHSKGSICIIVDNKYLFSGDSLLRDYPTITRLKGGSYKIYKENTLEFFKFLLPETIVYPGHYESFKLIERINSSNI